MEAELLILKILEEMKKQNKKNHEALITAVKKNRTTIIKHSFDKAVISEMIQANAEMGLEIVNKIEESKIETIRVMDYFVKKFKENIIKILK